MKQTIFHNSGFTTNIDTQPAQATQDTVKQNLKTIHTIITENYLATAPHNKILNIPAPPIHPSEINLPRPARRNLAQLRTNKSPLLLSYLNKIDPATHPSPLCPLCLSNTHDTIHLFSCPEMPTSLSVGDLWADPVNAAGLLARWGDRLGWPQNWV
jgi:hypothetical protein